MKATRIVVSYRRRPNQRWFVLGAQNSNQFYSDSANVHNAVGGRLKRSRDDRQTRWFSQQVSSTERQSEMTPPSPQLPPGLAAKILGHAVYIRKNPESKQSPFFLFNQKRREWYQETGSRTIMLTLGGNKLVYCADPNVYREVLGGKQTSFTNSNRFRAVFGFLFPKSMIVLEGDDWQRVRRVSQKAINRMNMDAVVGAVVEVMDTGLKHDAFGKPDGSNDVDTYRLLSHLTFDGFHKVMYGMDPRTVTEDPSNPHIELLQNCEDLLGGIQGRAFSKHLQLLWNLPTKRNRALERNRKYIMSVVEKITSERRAALKREQDQGHETKSLLDGLLLSQQEDIMSDKEVSDQIATFFFGAYETTSNTLLFALNSLAENPAVQTKLREEIFKRFPNGKQDIAKAKLADLDEVKYLMWTLDESFRMNSTASAFTRDVIKDVNVGGYDLKKGMSVVIDHGTASRDPYFFPGQTDLEAFNPSRYENFSMDKLVSLPFGFGSRICPGRKVALAQVKTIVALIVSQFEILPPLDPAKKLVLDSKLGLTCVDGTGFLRFRKL